MRQQVGISIAAQLLRDFSKKTKLLERLCALNAHTKFQWVDNGKLSKQKNAIINSRKNQSLLRKGTVVTVYYKLKRKQNLNDRKRTNDIEHIMI